VKSNCVVFGSQMPHIYPGMLAEHSGPSEQDVDCVVEKEIWHSR
jgi:hypothetical protein